MKLPSRISALFFIGIFVAGSTALGYYYYFVYSPPLTAAARFMDALESGNREALRAEIVVSSDFQNGREDKLRDATEEDLDALLSEPFERGRILDQRKREGNTRDYYYLVYREPDGRVFALVATEVNGRFRLVIPDIPMSKSHRFLWDYTWTN